MRNTFAILLIFFFSSRVFAAGGVWVLEIEFQLHNDAVQTGYLPADYWANDFERYVGADSLFQFVFRKQFGHLDSITIYGELHDREKISKIASFPMHPFLLVQESRREIRVADVKEVALVKVWKRTDYHINVLTHIHEPDSLWISDSASVEYPIGDDVGCRLEVYIFEENSDYSDLLQEFVAIYMIDKQPITDVQENGLRILDQLKALKVVVVELCGC